MNKKPQFEFYEIVIINSRGIKTQHLNGREAAILAMSQNENDGSWGYGVHVYGESHSWYFSEEELIATGRKDVRETFYDGTTIQVKVEQGKGRVVAPPESESDPEVL